MNYFASGDLPESFKQITNKFRKDFFFAVFLCLAFSWLMFLTHRQDEFLDPKFLIADLILLVTMTYLQYSGTVPKSVVINKTAIEVTLENDSVVIKTSAIKVLFWINKPTAILVFKLDELTVKNTAYPIIAVSSTKYGALKLTDRTKEAWVLAEFFDNELIETLSTESTKIR